MAHYVGLDVSLEVTNICVVDGSGTKVWQGKTSSQPEAIDRLLRRRAPEAVKVGFETGPQRWPPLVGQFSGVVKVDGVCCFHAAASISPAMGRPQYASSSVLPPRLEWGRRWL